MEYLLNKIVRFEHLFPKSSTSYLKENHYRIYLLKNKIEHHYYRTFPPNQLINFEKVKKGSIPVLILNYNRCETLVKMVDWLRSLNQEVSIIIADNNSSYTPLLQYYDQLDFPNVQVLRFDVNHGLDKLTALSQTLKGFDYYVLTDPDLVPYENTNPDILQRMMDMLDKYKDVNHVGASLEIKDIPDHYPLKDAVMKWEKQWWQVSRESGVYEAFVDTTFGMYRSNSEVMKLYPSLRLGNPYTLKHVDWYLDPKNISEETKHNLSLNSNLSTWMTRLKYAFKDVQFKSRP